MPTPDESKILKIVEAEGGECSVGRIAAKMQLDPNYVRIILRSMGENDIIDTFKSGKVRIGSKGWVGLGKKPQAAKAGLRIGKKTRLKWRIK